MRSSRRSVDGFAEVAPELFGGEVTSCFAFAAFLGDETGVTQPC